MIRRLPIRWRLTLAFALAMALVLAVVAIFLRVSLQNELDDGIDTSLNTRADELSALAGAGSGSLAGPAQRRLSSWRTASPKSSTRAAGSSTRPRRCWIGPCSRTPTCGAPRPAR